MPLMRIFRRPQPSQEDSPKHEQYQVELFLCAHGPCTQDDLESALERGVAALVLDAQGIALGPVGGIDLTTSTIELEFTVEAVSPAVFYAKMGEILRVMERAGFEYASSKEERVAARPSFTLQPA